MRIKLQYIIIAILVVTNIYFILSGKRGSHGSDNSEYKREMNYLEKRIKFDENYQLLNSSNQPYSIVHQYDKKWNIFKDKVDFLKIKLNIKF